MNEEGETAFWMLTAMLGCILCVLLWCLYATLKEEPPDYTPFGFYAPVDPTIPVVDKVVDGAKEWP